MQWRDRRQSTNVEDRRGRRVGVAAGGGLGLLLLVAIAVLTGDPSKLLESLGGGGAAMASEYQPTPEEEERASFAKVVLAETEDVWRRIFAERGATYVEPTLVLFSGGVSSACGMASAAVGPFYCPSDRNVYLDLSFFTQLERELGAPGDFAQAYVVAHEVGHHVQNLLGIMERLGPERSNDASVRLELQADFLAGVWAHHAKSTAGILEAGDLEEALNAASQIGDDRLQQRAQGSVVPDSFTHGTSAQRVEWFRRGYESGDIEQGNTFAAKLR